MLLDIARHVAEVLDKMRKAHFPGIVVSEPRPALVEKKANKYTWCLLLKSYQVNDLHNSLKTLRNNLKLPHTVSLKVDVDPACIG